MLLLLLLLLLLHSFPFFLFFLCLFFKHFTSITRIHPSVMHTFLIVSSFIHASIHDLHAPLLLCLFFCCLLLLLHSSSYLNFLCVCVFSPAFIFCWFSCFFFSFALLATFRLIKDNSVIIIVFFFFAFLAVFLYSAVYVWVFRFVCICFSSIYGIL